MTTPGACATPNAARNSDAPNEGRRGAEPRPRNQSRRSPPLRPLSSPLPSWQICHKVYCRLLKPYQYDPYYMNITQHGTFFPLIFSLSFFLCRSIAERVATLEKWRGESGQGRGKEGKGKQGGRTLSRAANRRKQTSKYFASAPYSVRSRCRLSRPSSFYQR